MMETAVEHTQAVLVDRLHPNDYNPNTMTDDEFFELVAEVRHLGRLPKPVIVRPNGDGYIIIDGEHGWKAAKEVGLETVPVEIVEVDDFEARRQTYKRNQHGTHNPVRLGKMFEAMMAERNLSQRALAEAIEISEGTIRNALEYAKAVAVRNRYAEQIALLNVRQVRILNRLPEVLAELWLHDGADIKLVEKNSVDAWSGDTLKEINRLAEMGFFHISNYSKNYNFKNAVKRAKQLEKWESQFYYPGLTWEVIRPYTRHHFNGNFFMRESDMAEGAIRTVLDTSTTPPHFVLTPEEFDAVLEHTGEHEAESAWDFKKRLKKTVIAKIRKPVPIFKSKRDFDEELARTTLQDAPEWIRAEGKTSWLERLNIYEASGPEWKKRQLIRDGVELDRLESKLKWAGELENRLKMPKEQMASMLAETIKYRIIESGLADEVNFPEILEAFCKLNRLALHSIYDAFSTSFYVQTLDDLKAWREGRSETKSKGDRRENEEQAEGKASDG